MTADETADLFDTDLQSLFAGVQPAAAFEDRLIAAVRQRRRLRLVIPSPVRRAAIAAAAVLMVGTVGYYGNRAIMGHSSARYASAQNDVNTESNALAHGVMASDNGRIDGDKWDFSGGSNSAANWTDSNGDKMEAHAQDGQNVWYGDGHAEVEKNTASGNAGKSLSDAFMSGGFAKSAASPFDSQDSALLPGAGGDGLNFAGGNLKARTPAMPAIVHDQAMPPAMPAIVHDHAVKGLDSRNGTLTIGGANTYTGGTTINGGTLSIAGGLTKAGSGNLGIVNGTNGPALDLPGLATHGTADQSGKVASDTRYDFYRPSGSGTDSFAVDSQHELKTDLARLDALKPFTTSATTSGQWGMTTYTPTDGMHSQDWVSNVGNAAVPAQQPGGQASSPFQQLYGGKTEAKSLNRITVEDGDTLSFGGQTLATQGEKGDVAKKGGPSVLADQLSHSQTEIEEAKARGDAATRQLAAVNKNGADKDAMIKNLEKQTDMARFKSEILTDDMVKDLNAKGGQAPILAQNFPTVLPLAQPGTNPTTAPAAVIDDRKIIRTGTMEFEVDRFDTAQMQITKIVLELGGFVGATDSTKLPNGKVRGSISVRVPPERLDVLVMSLRALGDLKSQQITAADISKEYNDLQSELAADRAMQDRLLDLIHNGKGAVKDLLAAENELGNWRTKIEKAEGMIRYYNGQVALSTLAITLSERDIQTPATAVETETADVGIEADDVEKARSSALKAIDDAKGRVVQAELKRFDAGQLAARLVVDVPPESAGAVIDQLKLLGKVARLEISRQQTNSDGTNTVTGNTPLKTERKPTRLLISIYNLANVAPRRTTNVSLAASDVEAAYTALASAAKTNGGRIVTSSLDRGDPVKATGSLVLEFPPDKFETAMTALHAQGDVLKLTLTENPDTQNSTEAKQGLTVQLISLAAVPPRESIQQTLAATDVPSAYQTILSAANSEHARVTSAQLNEQDRQNITADLQLEIPRSAQVDFDKAVAAAGGTIARTSNRSAEAEGTVDSKLAVHLSITSADHLAPRETTKLQVEVADVDKSAADAQAAAIAVGGRVLEATVTKDHGKGLARIILDLPLAKAGDVLQQIRGEGSVRGIDASRDANAPSGPLAHAQIFVEFGTTEAIVADQTGPWASIRQGLSTSITGLLWSLQVVIVGLCLIVPWVGIGWVGWKVKNRIRRKAPVG